MCLWNIHIKLFFDFILFMHNFSWLIYLHQGLLAEWRLFAALFDSSVLVHRLSLVVACRLSCSEACGILVPWPGIEPSSPVLQGRFLFGPWGKSPRLFFDPNLETTIFHGIFIRFIEIVKNDYFGKYSFRKMYVYIAHYTINVLICYVNFF